MDPRCRRLHRVDSGSSASSVSDVDTLDWSIRVSASGGSVSGSTLSAVAAFVSACKTSNVWTKLSRVNLFCGNNLSACLVPLKVGTGSASDTNFNFVSGDYSESTGLKGNGSNKYLNTGFVPRGSIAPNSTHLGIYNRSSVASSNGSGFGALSGAFILNMHHPWNDGVFYDDQYTSTAGRVSVAITGPYGFLVGSRVSGTDHKIYKNGAQIAANTGGSGDQVPDKPVFVFALNSESSPAYHSNYSIGGYTIGSGLTAADVLNLTTAMESFQYALGRNVA